MVPIAKCSFLIVLLCLASFAHAQKITFGRDFNNARHKQSKLEKLIEKDSSIEVAFGKLSGYFLPEKGEKFILIGKKCIEGNYRTKYFNIFPAPAVRSSQRGLMVTRSDDPLFKWLGQYSGTILLFGDHTIDLSGIKDIYEVNDVWYHYRSRGKMRSRKMKFDPLKKELLIDRDIYESGDDLNSLSDTKITIGYRHSKRIDELTNIMIVFATKGQEHSFREIITGCPDISSACISTLIEDLGKTGVVAFTEDIAELLKQSK